MPPSLGVKGKVANALAAIKGHTVLDAACVSALRQIPFVGDFLSEWYDRSGGKDEDKTQEILAFLTRLQDGSEERFNEISELIQKQHSEILKQINDNHLTITDLVEKSKHDIIRSITSIFYQSFGLTWVSSDYFDSHESTEDDLELWRKGFSFRLEDIKARKEFKREHLVEEIEERLKANRRLLLAGESGTSKSTILMEVMCDYYNQGYTVLWNADRSALTNGAQLVKFIEDTVSDYNGKVLVAVDDAQDERQAAIFWVMDYFENHRLKEGVRFLVAARLPEYDRLVEDRLGAVKEAAYRESIRKFNSPETVKEFRYNLPYFNRDEIREFFKCYNPNLAADDVDRVSDQILASTGGHPTLVKFSLLGRGSLREDASNRFANYICDAGKADPMKMQVVLVCSLLDMVGLPIKTELLEKMGLMDAAWSLHREILYTSNGLWRTLHPIWCFELLSFLFDTHQEEVLYDRKKYLRKAVQCIFDLQDEQMTYSTIDCLYQIVRIDRPQSPEASRRFQCLRMDVVESTVGAIPAYLSNETKAKIHGYTIGCVLHNLGRDEEALKEFETAMALNPDSPAYHYNIGTTMHFLKRYGEALKELDEAIGLNPANADYHYNRGKTLRYLGRYGEAVSEYEKAIELNPRRPDYHSSLGFALHVLKRFDEALREYDKAAGLEPTNPAWRAARGDIFSDSNRPEEALSEFREAIRLSPANPDYHYNAGNVLCGLGRFDEGAGEFDEAIRLDPTNADNHNTKGNLLRYLGRLNEALEEFDSALRIDPTNPSYRSNRGDALFQLKRFEEAVKEYEAAIALNPDNPQYHYYKGLAYLLSGDKEKARQVAELGLKLFPNEPSLVSLQADASG